MNLLLDVFVKGGFLLDAFGVLGLGLLGLAAVRLSQRYRSWGGSLLATGAFLLLIGRLWVLIAPLVLTPGTGDATSATLSEWISLAPIALLTTGLAGVVWGLWGHEQWLRTER
ncbi:MAG: hypothetical protein EAZ84_09715 [Verrucomicrobia bacterium]|nr:MAG: hypothetical protein EAZ84_09715 [Verrucomicrobiota bacterium]TAE86729.1 MAG: hypothetical protein EAZ82_10090 [Verrucomicrobiota bacterium]TAF24511.1 MAG: hypothetical protein EAZ71_10385 [Verrucomicrobiota bacterium]